MTLHEIIEEIKEMDRGIRFPEDSYEAGQKDAYWSVLDLLTKAESEEKAVDMSEHYKKWMKEYIEQNDGYYPTAGEIAHHFYELGCRHTAVMYDDIEYNRQRAEEAEISGDLEEEINRYLEPIHTADIQFEPFTQMTKCARHFAEWGAEHLKK